MKISQLAKATGVSTRSIRHYEKKRLLDTKRLENNYREFEESAIERVKTIQIYLGLGMTTDEILEILLCHDAYVDVAGTDEFCEDMLDAYEQKRDEIVKQIRALAAVQQRLDQRIEQMKERRSDGDVT
ncbi:MerR family transcriptional regulator [Paenibacillus piri]|uniref:MerR family transcriptional regulator n=1 Tax=Paenibacillus piri TaxID=2547395 RepID=A0A4R5KW38_9BACL|nr:MerR family transcriptional regulator [Paenibacillus piri]TDG00222.1 MerR family transcriptional regulator [Paenibacillus piri]